MADVTIDKIEIEVKATAKSASDVLKDLEANLKAVKTAMTGIDISALENIQKRLDAIDNKTKSIAKTKIIPKIDTSKLDRAEQKIRDDLDKIQDKATRLKLLETAAKGGDSSALTSWKRLSTSLQGDIDVLQNKLKRLGETRTPSEGWKQWFDGDKIQKYRDGLHEVQTELNGAKKSMQELGQESKSVDTSALVANLKNVGATALDVTKRLLNIASGAIKAGIKTLSSLFGKLKSAVASVRDKIKDLTKWTDKGFMRILKYGFGIRSVYVLFRRLRKAIVDSFGELRKSGAFFETTDKNIQQLKNSLTLLKYQFGAAFEPIFNEVAPALQTFVDHLLKAMNSLSAFTAKLMGKDSYSKAVLATENIEDNIDGAAKKAKEFKKQLQGFDELNNMTTNDGSGKGTSGSGDSDDLAVTYVSESVDNVLGDFGKLLAQKIREGSWGEVGSAISEKLTAALKSLNEKWPDIFAGANEFGTKLAEFFKGLITPELFSEVGTAIANALKTALIALKGFADTLNEVDPETNLTGWQKFGQSLAAAIKSFVEENPLKLAVETFSSLASGILDGLLKAITDLLTSKDGQSTIKKIAQQIADAIGSIPAKDLAFKVGEIVNGLTNAIYVLVSNKETWTNLGQKIADGINGFFAGMSEVNPETGLTGFEAFAKSLVSVITGLADTISTALENIEWEKVGEGINEIWSNIEWKEITKSLSRLKDALKEALKGLLKGLDIDAKDVVITLAGVGLVVASITGISLAASITKAALTSLITNAITGLLTGGTGAAAGAAEAAGAAGTAGAAAGASGIAVSLGSVALTFASITVAMGAAATIGYTFGTTLADFAAAWLEEKGIISKDTKGELWAINEMSITQKIKDIKLAAGTVDEQGKSDLQRGLELAIDEMYGPVFDEGKSLIATLETKVKLVKDGWTTVSDWIVAAGATAVSSAISLVKNFGANISTVADFVKGAGATAVTSAVGLATKGWSTVAGWITGAYLGNAVNKGIGLTKDFGNNINTVYDWITAAGQWGGAIKKKIGLKQSDGWTTVAAWIENSAQWGGAVSKKIKLAQDGWTSVSQWINAYYNSTPVTAFVQLAKATGSKAWTSIKSFVFNKPKSSVLSQAQQTVKVFVKLAKSGWSSIKSFFGLSRGGILGANGGLTLFGDGGIISESTWNKLPKYAKGSNNVHGSLFVAGENGPEIMGHINGRTEVLNKSQIAATMYSAIAKGMQQFKNAQMVSPQAYQFTGTAINNLANAVSASNNDSAIVEQNRLLAEQNRLLQRILEKPSGITSREVFDATRKEAQNYYNRTGNSPYLY